MLNRASLQRGNDVFPLPDSYADSYSDIMQRLGPITMATPMQSYYENYLKNHLQYEIGTVPTCIGI